MNLAESTYYRDPKVSRKERAEMDADITYIRINTGVVYLAVVLDLYSRKVIGWAISKKIDGKLTLSALKMAIKHRKPSRGVQYLVQDLHEGVRTG